MTSSDALKSIIGGKDDLRYGVFMILHRGKRPKWKGGVLIVKR